jgi:hypothetical protein
MPEIPDKRINVLGNDNAHSGQQAWLRLLVEYVMRANVGCSPTLFYAFPKSDGSRKMSHWNRLIAGVACTYL